MKNLFLSLLFLLSSAQAFAGDHYALWKAGNEHYKKGEYGSAVNCYEPLAAHRAENPELYYNLGNAYYKLNRIGPAVLNYKRALRIDPGYDRASDNLLLTESRIPNRIRETQEIFFLGWWHAITSPHLSETWAIVSLFLCLLVVGMLLARLWNRAPSWMRTQVIVFTGTLCLLSLTIAYNSAAARVSRENAVVMIPDAPFHENANTAAVQTLVPEGTVIRIMNQKSELAEVKLPDGRRGWMDLRNLQKI